jgi:hypothetical protein
MFKSFAEKLPTSSKPSSRSPQPSKKGSPQPSKSRSPQPSKKGAPAAPDPTRPATLQWAVKLMVAGAAASTVYLVFAIIVTASIKTDLSRWNATQPKAKQYTASQLNSLATYYVVSTIVIGLLAIGLWLWMAKMNGNGRKWARIVATVLFALWSYYTYVSIGETHGAATLVTSTGIVLVTWLIGLASLFLLWRPASSAFYSEQTR